MTLDKLSGTTRERYKWWEREREREERKKKEREREREQKSGGYRKEEEKIEGGGEERQKKKRKKKSRVNTNYTVRYGTIRQMFVGGKRSRIGKGSVDSFISRVLISNIYYYYLELIIYNSESILYFIILVLMLRSTSYSIGLTVLQNIGTAARPDKVRGQLVLSRYPCRIQRRKSDLVGTLFPDLVS